MTAPRFSLPPASARAALATLPALAAALFAAEGGATATGAWMPVALAACLICAGVLAFSTPLHRGPGLWAIAAFALLALWSAGSTAWATLPGEATLEAARALFYAAVFAFCALVVRSIREAEVAIAAIAVAGAGVVLYALASLASSPPADWFVEGRLGWPAGYPNAAAACLLVPLFPLVGIASERRLPSVLRALALAGATGCAGLATLTESRGALLALGLGGPLALIVTRERLRLLAPIALVAACAAPTVPRLRASLETGASAATASAAQAVLWAMAAAAAVGLAYALFDRRIELSKGTRRLLALAVLALVVTGVGAAGGVALAHDGPGHASRAWERFQRSGGVNDGSLHLFDTSTSNRYDFWRVALDDLVNHPVSGVGAGSFGPSYQRLGASDESPAQAHGQIFELASTLGLPGVVLGGAVAVIGLGGLASRRRVTSPIVGGALVGAVCALAHAQTDWQWQVPSAAIPTLALLGTGAGLCVRGASLGRMPQRAAAVSLVGAAALWALPVFWSATLTDRALRSGDASSARLAGLLNPFDPAPQRARAHIEAARGNSAGAYRVALAATRRAPGDWTTWALAASLAPTPTTHADACARARHANPRLTRCPRGAA